MGMLSGVLQSGVPLAFLLAVLFYIPCFIMLRHRQTAFLNHLAHFMLIAYSCLIIYATVLLGLFAGAFQFPPEYYFLNLQPFIWLRETYSMGWQKMIEQLCLNVIMFLPVGLLLPALNHRWRSWGKTISMTLLFTVTIEFCQYFIGRSADIDDVIMNLLGGAIGYAFFFLLDRFFLQYSWWQQFTGRVIKKKATKPFSQISLE